MSHQTKPQHPVGLGKSSRSTIHRITGTQVQRLIAKLQLIDGFLPEILLQEIISSQDYMSGEVQNGSEGGKHVLQEVSILGHLRRIQALDERTARAIELGAGTGKLSDRLQRATDSKLDHILIDRQDFAPNQSRDRVLKARAKLLPRTEGSDKSSNEPRIERVVVDIGEMELQDYIYNDGKKKTLCMSKHLCGPACDLTIHSISNAARQLPPSLRPPPAAIATCCHYLCTWDSFAGKDFWLALGLSEEDFVVATSASQWSSLQDKKKITYSKCQDTYHETVQRQTAFTVEKESQPSGRHHVLPNLFLLAAEAKARLDATDMSAIEKSFLPSEEFEKSFSRQEKAMLGMRVKQLLDTARAASCQIHCGYEHVELVRYTTRSIEDRLLLLY